MKLKEACALVQDIAQVPVTLLDSEASVDAFCRRWQFHRVQDYLQPASLKAILSRLNEENIICLTDCFQVDFIFLLVGDTPVAFGPYRGEMITAADADTLLRRAGLTKAFSQDLRGYRAEMSILSESHALHYLHCMLENLHDPAPEREHLSMRRVPEIVQIDDTSPSRPHADIVQERYRLEQQMLEHIAHGEAAAAIASWKALHRRVDYLKTQLGQTMQAARLSAAVTRTTIRVAAMGAGVPAVINDQISGKSTRIVNNATTIDEINAEHERLIRDYCALIRRLRDHKYSLLVLSVLYYIERDFATNLTVHSIAEELGVSVGYLIDRFRAETATTPGAYLQFIRLKDAARLLADSDLPVQEVCARVGIPDANYFSKLFKRAYRATPLLYRKKHQL